MIPYDKRSGKIWYNGELVDWSNVKVHVLSHGLHYASCVFEGQFQIIGTFSPKSKTWRFAWANRYVPNDIKRTSLKLMEFGESNDLPLFSEPKIKDDKMGLIFTAIGMKLSNAKGYYIIPADGEYPEIFLVFTKVRKIKKSINKIIKDNEKNNLSKKRKYEKLLKV